MFHLRFSLWSSDLPYSIFTSFSFLFLLATTILTPFSYSNVPNTSRDNIWNQISTIQVFQQQYELNSFRMQYFLEGQLPIKCWLCMSKRKLEICTWGRKKDVQCFLLIFTLNSWHCFIPRRHVIVNFLTFAKILPLVDTSVTRINQQTVSTSNDVIIHYPEEFHENYCYSTKLKKYEPHKIEF